jgi:hypothetical protein
MVRLIVAFWLWMCERIKRQEREEPQEERAISNEEWLRRNGIDLSRYPMENVVGAQTDSVPTIISR